MNESSDDWINLVLTVHLVFYAVVLIQGLGFYVQVKLFLAFRKAQFPTGNPFWDDIINSLGIAFVFNSSLILLLCKL